MAESISFHMSGIIHNLMGFFLFVSFSFCAFIGVSVPAAHNLKNQVSADNTSRKNASHNTVDTAFPGSSYMPNTAL